MHKFHFIALGAHGVGISGGDRIFMEFAREWSKTHDVVIHVSREGRAMCERQGLTQNLRLNTKDSKQGGGSLEFVIYNPERFNSFGFLFEYIARIITGIKIGLTLPLATSHQSLVTYSCSEFWMDSLPAFFVKLRNRKTTWLAAWYQTAPNPLRGFAEGARQEKYRLKALSYWLLQLPIKPLVSGLADYVVVNNVTEEKYFPKFAKRKKLITLLGAIPLEGIQAFQKKHKRPSKFTYDAVFMGRFHPQKGVLELIDIWKKVVGVFPNAKLAMVGDGPLMVKVKSQITNLKLQKNIELKGFMFDGDAKYKVFNESRVVVHPALFDSGGMASAEAMVFGSPCVGFDLASYKSYYPKGMVKAPIGDLDKFTDLVIKFLRDEKLRKKVGEEAKEEITKNWSWEKRANDVLGKIV